MKKLIANAIAASVFSLKGWEFYVWSWSFWAKMAAFAGVGLLSVVPTMRILAWRRQSQADPTFLVPAAELARVRGFMRGEMALFTLVPIFAAMMARGYG